MTKKNGKYKDLKINLLISFTTVLLFFLVFEIILRLFWEEPGPGGYPLGLYQPDDLLGFKHVSNFTGYYPSLSYKDIEITINSKGLRDKEYEYEKNSGTIRILGLGDSVTFGVGIKEEDTFLAVLESKLNNNSKPVEVINAGIASYTSHHEFKYFYRDLVKYDADVVILNVAINDLNYHNIEKLKKEYAKDKPLLSHFGLPQFIFELSILPSIITQ